MDKEVFISRPKVRNGRLWASLYWPSSQALECWENSKHKLTRPTNRQSRNQEKIRADKGSEDKKDCQDRT